MSLRDEIEKAGSFKALFDSLKARGVNVAEQMQEAFSRDRLFSYVGFTFDRVDTGFVQLSFPLSENVVRRGGMVHGGIVMLALDNACGLAAMTMNSGKDQVTMELKVNFLEPLREGPFCAVGKVIRSGKTTMVVEGEVRDSRDTLCAKSIGTWFALISSTP